MKRRSLPDVGEGNTGRSRETPKEASCGPADPSGAEVGEEAAGAGSAETSLQVCTELSGGMYAVLCLSRKWKSTEEFYQENKRSDLFCI